MFVGCIWSLFFDDRHKTELKYNIKIDAARYKKVQWQEYVHNDCSCGHLRWLRRWRVLRNDLVTFFQQTKKSGSNSLNQSLLWAHLLYGASVYSELNSSYYVMNIGDFEWLESLRYGLWKDRREEVLRLGWVELQIYDSEKKGLFSEELNKISGLTSHCSLQGFARKIKQMSDALSSRRDPDKSFANYSQVLRSSFTTFFYIII